MMRTSDAAGDSVNVPRKTRRYFSLERQYFAFAFDPFAITNLIECSARRNGSGMRIIAWGRVSCNNLIIFKIKLSKANRASGSNVKE